MSHQDGAVGSLAHSRFAIARSLTRSLAVSAACAVAIVALPATIAFADGIEAGLWKITSTAESGGIAGPPRQSSKCLSAEQVKDLPAMFSPIASTINSACEPMQRTFDGKQLSWHLTCKGQLDMELNGVFDFDSPHHYTGTVHSRASMAGQLTTDSKNTVEGEWVSACPQ